MVNSRNPFAEGGPSKKHERLVAFTSGYTLLKYIFFLPKSSTSDATVVSQVLCIQ
jgi:hypothetical protein